MAEKITSLFEVIKKNNALERVLPTEEYVQWLMSLVQQQHTYYEKNNIVDKYGDGLTIPEFSRDQLTNVITDALSNASTAEEIAALRAPLGSTGAQLNKVLHQSLNIDAEPTGLKQNEFVYEYFDRYYSIYTDLELTNLNHYIFMTRPDLNLLNASSAGTTLSSSSGYTIKNQNKTTAISLGTAEPLFGTLWETCPWVIKSLTSYLSSDHQFLPVITGRAENLQIPDYAIKSYNLQQPFTGYILPYASHAIASETGGTFDLTLREFSDLSLHKMMQAWLVYIDGVTRNKFKPLQQYINENRADYMVSLYDIICGPDGKTILYWVKYVGCLPTLNSNSVLSFNLRDRPDNRISIPFDYFKVEIMKPYSLADFNLNAGMDSNSTDTEKNPQTATQSDTVPDFISNSIPFSGYGTGYGMVSKPFIYKNPESKLYELVWAPIK